MQGKENLRKRRQFKTNYLWIHKSKLQECINSRRYFFLWQVMAGMFLFLLIITTKVRAELFGFHFQIKDGTSFSKENTLWTGKTGSIISCSHLCARREACKIAMFWVNQRTCSLLDTAQREEGQKRPQHPPPLKRFLTVSRDDLQVSFSFGPDMASSTLYCGC